MATAANRLIQDQNLNILYNGVTPSGKTDVSKPAKKGGLGGRKALNDISNSRKTSIPQLTKKDNPTNILSIEKDPCAAGKGFSKVTEKEKGKVSGRKALGDLTNSVRQTSQHASKTGLKLEAVYENIPISMADERFMHNHQECIKAQTKGPDMDFFLKSMGLNNAARGFLSPPKKVEGNMRRLVMEEMLYADEARWCKKSELVGYCSPACRSPKSPTAPYMNWEDVDSFSDLMVISTP